MRSFVFLVAAILGAAMTIAAEEKHIVCYFGSWATYRPGAGKFQVDNINPRLCTHYIYAFAGLNVENNGVKVLDPWQDLADGGGHDGFRRFTGLRRSHPEVKFLIAIGGWGEGSGKYSRMTSNVEFRGEFIESAIAFARTYGFDGIDLDWEYPAQRGGAPDDVQNFVNLLREMRRAFDREGLLLTVAVAAARPVAYQSYSIAEISRHVHLINLMAYDLHGPWEAQTGLNAPGWPAGNDNSDLTVDSCVRYWLSQGADPAKIVLGVAAYGRSFTLADPENNGVGAPAVGPGRAGPYTGEAGSLGYNEICSESWTVVFDEARRAPYAFRGDQWVGFDNAQSVWEKAEYVNTMGLGGAMVWSIETDDFRGNCGEAWPLLMQLNRVLRN